MMKCGCCCLVYVLLLATANARSVKEVKEDEAGKGSDVAVTEIPVSSEHEEPKVECAPVKCSPLCREAVGQFGCPMCLCDPACTPPKCDPGCRIQFEPSLGPCPGCVCDGDDVENQNISAFAIPHSVPLQKCQCDWRYLKHYATKKCTPVFEEGCDCPVKFDCPESLTTPENVCEYKGKTYELGEDITTLSICEICSCRNSFYGGVEISCIPIECPSLFRPPPAEGCYDVYEDGKCCSVATKCPDDDSEKHENVTEPICEYGGRTYHSGERIYPEEDPCLSCLCDENWEGVKSNSCRLHECLLERNLGNLKRGCIPIYHEKTCCPIEFHCGTGSEENLNDTLTPKSDGGCTFEGKTYSIGEELDIQHPTNCVTCTCSTPPDFTCVHASCPRPPNDDYENCAPIYNEGVCCPTYDCAPHSAPFVSCEPVECKTGCTEVFGPDGCSLCLCDQVLCSPPKCPDACVVEYDVPKGSCPHCKCPITVQRAPVQCAPKNCGPQCFEAVGSDGCTECYCGPLCLPPKCDDGCSIQKYFGTPGPCPGCDCPPGSSGQEIQCGIVKCPPGCREVEGEFGCPTCFCEPLCSPPRCDPGCEVETVPSSGPCPGCVCGDHPAHHIQCAPVKCSPGCREATGQFGCPTCLCDPLCSPPKCDPGCEVELVPSSGPCPGCVCKGNEPGGIQCAPLKCAPTCRTAVGDFGCPTCVCDPLCSPPKCDPGCVVESVPSSGPCPGCVCGGDLKIADIQCDPIKCAPTCHTEVGESGCPTCVCDPLCSPPKCAPGCEIETVPSSGPCPGCVCGDEVKVSDIQCAPVKCAPTCHTEVGESGCPTCVCDPLCSPPKCAPGCEIETVPSSGPCPGCVCGDEKKGPQVECAPVKCGPQCREAVGQFGCPVCLCDPLCSPPKCDPGCEIETVPSSGPCPGCVCKDQPENKVQCAPVKCGPLCREAVGQYGCAMCLCDPLCSPPKCDPGCRAEVVPSLGPCPGCVCDKDKGSP